MGSVDIPSNVKDPRKIEIRRAQIVEAAVQLFIDKGFHPTTTREIAKASGLSSGALYEYVQSKEDILLLVCRHIHGEMEHRIQASLDAFTKQCSSECTEHSQVNRLSNVAPQGVSGYSRLEQAIWSLLNVIDEMPDEVLLIYQESKSLPHEALTEVLEKESAITRIFEQLIYAGVDDGSLHVAREAVPILAHEIVVSAQMWAFRRWALRHVDFQQFAEIQVHLLLQACGAREKADKHMEKIHGSNEHPLFQL